MSIETGTRIGRYEVQSLIGAGGMGEVYRALDTELHRPVALKFLRPEVAADEKRMQRFIQEARSASALNHPNILTVYEIGQQDGARFFSTEFVDGLTLRAALVSRRMKLIEVLDVAIQVASALSAAHAAGIVHRDIKPENIMLRGDGYVKVLDFGLAKVIDRTPSSVDTEAATQALINTDPGSVMGTAHYMSPEQASAKEVDARTDIWSLGCVLYEMVTGHVPFEGKTTSHVIVAILEKEPLPMSTYTEGVPEALEWIVTEALTKDREERTQTARELLKKLQRLKQRVDADAELERSVAPDRLRSTGGVTTGSMSQSIQPTVGTTSEHATARSDEVKAKVTNVSSAEYVVNQVKSHKKGVLLVLAVLALAGLGYGIYRFASRDKTTVTSKQMKITRLISGLKGTPGSVTISPDGKYVTYLLYDEGKVSLWVRQVSQDTSVQIIPPGSEDESMGNTTFSHDGEIIYFIGANQKTNPLGSLYQVPVLGGREPKKIMDHVTSPISLSPDGKRFAFVRFFQKDAEGRVMVANIDGSGERQLAARKGDDWFNFVAWSPDGQRIACSGGSARGGFASTVVEIPAEGGPEKLITTHKWEGDAQRLIWFSDGSGFVLSAREKQNSPAQIWHISYPSGEVRRITNDLNDYGSTSLGLTTDGSTLVTVQAEGSSKIWVTAPNEDESRARKITNGKQDGRSGITVMPDGRIVYATQTGDNRDLWVMNADGTNAKPLTSDVYLDSGPAVSPDGRYIYFHSSRPDTIPRIWRMDADGSNPKQLTTGEDYLPTVSPDGRWLVFSSWRSGKETLWKVSVDGGEPTQLTDKVSGGPIFSPDGKFISCGYYDESASPPRLRPALVSFADGQLVKFLDFPLTAQRPRWSPDGRDFIYIDTRSSVGNIWSQPVEGGPARQLTKFTADFIDNFAITPDGKRFIISRGVSHSDIVMMKDFK
jgi:serine/threonine protein kinase/dipeptidyl aminopeptidase/acylaminoacyl peptidase